MAITWCFSMALRPNFSTEPKGKALMIRYVPIACAECCRWCVEHRYHIVSH